MIVIYDKANTLNLPYADKSGAVHYFKFVPGRNEVGDEIWAAVVKYNEVRFEHYSKFLHALNEEAANDNEFDYEALTAREVSTLIENTMDVSQLEVLKAAENKRDKPRKSVLKDIDKQIKAISDFEEKVEAGA